MADSIYEREPDVDPVRLETFRGMRRRAKRDGIVSTDAGSIADLYEHRSVPREGQNER